mmetsp:Transcript_5670/g.8712  ORF Transcript_5670/g.8712 Transcript_5670/m.8712 type:complete len:128 (-) Transcript_5670:4703-5086(-)
MFANGTQVSTDNFFTSEPSKETTNQHDGCQTSLLLSFDVLTVHSPVFSRMVKQAFNSSIVVARSGIQTSPILLWQPMEKRLNHRELVLAFEIANTFPSSPTSAPPTPPGHVCSKLETCDLIRLIVPN